MTVCCTREAFPLFCASCLVIKISIHIEYRRLYSSCNGVNLHIVFVLLYSVCRSVNVLSCVDLIQFFYVRFTSYYIGRHKKTAGERERKREAIPAACRTVHKRLKNKTGISGCGSFIVAYVRPATSIDHLQSHYREITASTRT